MSYKVIKTTSHEQWLDERKKGVGSSEAGTIMGVNHFDTPYKLWRRKTGIDLPVEQNEAMEMGYSLSPFQLEAPFQCSSWYSHFSLWASSTII